jgi:hypothetical protein
MINTKKVSILPSRAIICSAGIIALTLLVIGCGVNGNGSSNNSSAATSGTSSNNITGTAECYTCHADGQITITSAVSSENNNIFDLWLNGPHGNYEGLYSADNGINNEGFPSYEYDGLGSDQSCIDCHDYRNDGLGLGNYYLETSVNYLGIVDRPIVGCESCHGSGLNHFGIGTITGTPGPDACGLCHDAGVGQAGNHLTYHPEADSINEDYQASPHASSINSHNYDGDSTTDVKASCSRCHTDEGAKLYKDMLGGNIATSTLPSLSSLIAYASPPIADASNIQCRTCHDAHDPDKLLLSANESASSEYRTCTNCHLNLLDDDGHDNSYHGYNSAYSWSGHAVGSGALDGERTIMDTHFNDDSTTPEIEGYNIDTSNERVCRDCHNVHAADNSINEDWADSAHGGHINETIDTTIGLASVTETEGVAWVHYNFKEKTGGRGNTGRQACQRCHTSTGFKNFADDPANYDPVNNDFTYLHVYDGDGVEVPGSQEKREMLYCWACHTSSAGDFRDPGAFVNVATYSSPADRISAVPDLGGSNICLPCHSGRESGTEDITDSTSDFNNKSFVNSHYLAAGGIMFRTIGYEYDGQDYDNIVYYTHDQIGTTSDTDMGSNGPCVGCHMKSPNGHTFENVTKDSGGDITDITAYDNVCTKCHPDKTALITSLNNRKDGFEAALDALATQMSNNGFTYLGGYPYFSSKDWDPADNGDGKKNMGAAFNFAMLLHEPGAYVHNSQYTRKLLYDSIDFLDDGTLNRSVEATLGGSGAAFDYLGGTR